MSATLELSPAYAGLSVEEREGLRLLAEDTPLYCETALKIVDKDANLVPLKLSVAQMRLWALILQQIREGKPIRIIVLKARQVGISTLTQGILIQRCTLNPNHRALVVAHDLETGGLLYQMGQRMYANLPGEPGKSPLKPDLRSYGRSRLLHFASKGDPGAPLWPDSTYFVNTAGETESGRGGTYHSLHLSELAFWPNITQKLTGLLQAVPDNPNSLIIIESTANGHNAFKKMWDDAEAGRSEYLPFFFPWQEEPGYVRRFTSNEERANFRVGDTTQSPFAGDEPMLVETYGLSLEQLNWRRWTIANKCQGQVEVFQQEYPSSPEEAFIATGRNVFDANLVKGVLLDVKKTDPAGSDPRTDAAPQIKTMRALKRDLIVTPNEDRIWLPQPPFELNDPNHGEAPFKLWLPEDGVPADGAYVIGVDAASGMAQTEGGRETDWHAIQVIDHKSREQVAEYRSRVEPMMLAEVVYMAAKFFNDAWVSVEVTGSHGLPTARRLFLDYKYPFVYTRRSHDTQFVRTQDRLGWSTDRRTKPLMEAGGQELLREGTHGIKSRDLASEMLTYVRNDKGKTGAQPGEHDDLLLAWLIAQQSANELPIRSSTPRRRNEGYGPRDPVTGY